MTKEKLIEMALFAVAVVAAAVFLTLAWVGLTTIGAYATGERLIRTPSAARFAIGFAVL